MLFLPLPVLASQRNGRIGFASGLHGWPRWFFARPIGIYGFDYYRLPRELRPFSDKHELLRPSGLIGINLGVLGTVLFFIIFLYALRKVFPWLGRMGTAKHWMDFHIICGVTAPIIIAFHASFKFNNIAGVAFWIMLAVALSGIGGALPVCADSAVAERGQDVVRRTGSERRCSLPTR